MRAPEFWEHRGLMSALLTPAGKIWQARSAARIRRTNPTKVDIPVICVGNVVAGGAGKTPVSISIAESAHRQGAKPHFLSRGYGGSIKQPARVDVTSHQAGDVGDEPLLLARTAPTWIAHDRVAGARLAAGEGAEIIIMDDGFQNPSLHKDLSILVVDGGYGIGNGRVMPAGPLREPFGAALDRADAVAILGTDTKHIEALVAGKRPVIAARFVPGPGCEDLAGKPVVAFAGIGRPAKFFETLAGIDCDLIETRSFPDHHFYSADEIMRLIDFATEAGAIVVTTEKDAIRLSADASGMVRTLPVTLEWRDPDALDKMVASAIRTKA